MDQKETLLKILERYAQGVSLITAIRSYGKEDWTETDLIKAITENNLQQEWSSANVVRKTVYSSMKALEEKTKKFSDAGIALIGLSTVEESPEIKREVIERMNNEVTRDMYFKVALVHEMYKYTFLKLDECIDKVDGLDRETYHVHVATNKVLDEARLEVLAAREVYTKQKIEADRLTLMSQLFDNLLEHTKPDKVLRESTTVTEKVKKLSKDKKTLEIQGEITKTTDKYKEVLPSAHIIKTAMEALGWTKSQDAIMPEAAIELQNISQEELERQQEQLMKEYETMKEELNFIE